MREVAAELRREFYTFLHHLALLLVALAGAFLWWAWPSGDVPYNLLMAWRIEGPFVRAIVIVFIVLCVLRLATMYLFGRLMRKSTG